LFSLEASRSVPGRRLAVRFMETWNAERGVRNGPQIAHFPSRLGPRTSHFKMVAGVGVAPT